MLKKPKQKRKVRPNDFTEHKPSVEVLKKMIATKPITDKEVKEFVKKSEKIKIT